MKHFWLTLGILGIFGAVPVDAQRTSCWPKASEARPVKRLPLSTRKFIFQKIIDIETQSVRDADRVSPNMSTLALSDRHLALVDDFQAKYFKRLRTKYHLTEDERQRISDEGVIMRWHYTNLPKGERLSL